MSSWERVMNVFGLRSRSRFNVIINIILYEIKIKKRVGGVIIFLLAQSVWKYISINNDTMRTDLGYTYIYV